MTFMSLRDRHKGRTGYIIGKGPSLEHLTAHYFLSLAPVICMNQSIVVMQDLGLDNPLYSLQKDGTPADMVRPHDDVTLLLQDTDGYSKEWFPEHTKRILIDPVVDQKFQHPSVMAVRMCIKLALWMGCDFLLLVSCDSLTTGDARTYNIHTRTASVTTAAPWYENVRQEVLDDLKGIPHDFITPGN